MATPLDRAAAFPPELIARIAALEEVDLETRGRRSGEPRRVTVWVVVSGDEVFVRSEHAERGQWYRNVLADPAVTLFVEADRVAAGATRVTDAALLRRVTEAFASKYAHHESVSSMLGPVVEAATVRLSPR